MTTSATPTTHDNGWPRVYRRQRDYVYAMVFLGGGGLIFSGLAVWRFVRAPADTGSQHPLVIAALLLLMIAAFAGVCGSMIAEAIYGAFVLGPDSFTYRSLFGDRSMRRDEVAGGRGVFSDRLARLTIESVDPRKKPIKMNWWMRSDEVLDAWVVSLPNLDFIDRTRITEALRADPRLGASPEERTATLAAVSRATRRVAYASLAMGLWGLAYPRPYALAVILNAVLPLIVLGYAAKRPSAFSFDAPAYDPRVGVDVPLYMSALALAGRALFDINTLSKTSWLLPVTLTAAALTLGCDTLLRPARVQRKGRLLLAAVWFAWSYGAVCIANAKLDASSQRSEVTVARMHVSRGKTTTYELTLAPWSTAPSGARVFVSRRLYESAAVGRSVCVDLHRGFFAIPWFEVVSLRCGPSIDASDGAPRATTAPTDARGRSR